MRILVRIFLYLIAGVALAVVVVLVHGMMLFHQHPKRAVTPVSVTPDSVLVARGEHIASVMCANCHGEQEKLPLVGSDTNILQIPDGPKFGEMYGPNLTPAGALRHYPDDGLLARAIREGIGWDNRALLVMPSPQFHDLSDRDLAAVISYLRSQPPQGSDRPPRKPNLLGYAILGLHLFPMAVMPPVQGPNPGPAEDTTAAYGGYLVGILDCRTCHGPDLHGGKKGQLPPVGPDVVAMAQAHPVDIFDRAIRGGISSKGLPLNPTQMPWRGFSHLNDLEVRAIHAYLAAGGGTGQ